MTLTMFIFHSKTSRIKTKLVLVSHILENTILLIGNLFLNIFTQRSVA